MLAIIKILWVAGTRNCDRVGKWVGQKFYRRKARHVGKRAEVGR